MFATFLRNRIINSLKDLKLVIIFLLACVLFTLSTISGYLIYRQNLEEYRAGQTAALNTMADSGSYLLLKLDGYSVRRAPEPLSIFFRGADSAIGSRSIVNTLSNVQTIGSRNSIHPLFAAFGDIDFGFLFHTVFALFALLMAYDCVSGERERGLLKLIFSNNVSRVSYILGTATGGIIALWLVFFIPLLIALLFLLLFFDISFSAGEWSRLVLLFAGNLLYIGLIHLAGVCISALNRTSFGAFLYSLALWVVCIGIIPVFAMEAAVRLNPAPSSDSLESSIAAMRRDNFEYHRQILDASMRKVLSSRDSDDDRGELRAAINNAAVQAQQRFLAAEDALFMDYQAKHLALARTAKAFSRFSPASVIGFYSNSLAGTDEYLLTRFVDDLRRYRGQFVDYADRKAQETPDKSFSRQTGHSLNWNTNDKTGVLDRYSITILGPSERIDVSDVPRFSASPRTDVSIVQEALPDLAILIAEFCLLLVLAVLFFNRYDVRS